MDGTLRRRMLQVCAADYTAYYLLRSLFHAARERDWDVEFACADGEYAASLRAEGFRHREIPMTRSMSPLRHVRATLALAASLRRDPPHLIHTHTPIGGVIGRTASRIARHAVVVHTLHGLPFTERPRTPSEHAFLIADRLLEPHTGLFFSQSSADARTAVRLGLARARDTLVIGNGVDVTRFAPDEAVRRSTRAELGIADDATVVTCVARMVREKGLLDLADAALQLSGRGDLVFLLVGRSEPSDRTHLEDRLRHHPAALALRHKWRLLGARSDVDRILKASDLFVLPSYREGLPRSIIEAMATGIPVVATALPGCRELVEPGATGALVPAGDSAALARAIADTTASPLRHELGARAREVALARHDERGVLRRQLDLLEAFVSRADRRSAPASPART